MKQLELKYGHTTEHERITRTVCIRKWTFFIVKELIKGIFEELKLCRTYKYDFFIYKV